MMQRALQARREVLASSSSPPSAPHPGSRGEEGEIHFYCSSGGNAGLACATAAAALSRRDDGVRCTCTIVVPLSTAAHMVAKLRAIGATVHQVGADWAAADAHLREELLARDADAGVYVPPFDHPHVWEGAATMVDEIVRQTAGRGIDAIVCSVGGGGLLNGIMEGVEARSREKKGWSSGGKPPHVLAVETRGADSLDASVRAGELVTLPAITSVATSLGARRVSARTLEWALSGRQPPHRLDTLVVSDRDAVAGAVRFADDARMLVEVACGAAVAPVYNGDLRRVLGPGLSDAEWAARNVVLVICGGSNVTLETLRGYCEKFGLDGQGR